MTLPDRCLLCRRRPPKAGDGLLVLCDPCLWAAIDANQIHGFPLVPVSLDADTTRATGDGYRPPFVDGGETGQRAEHDRRVAALEAWAELVDEEPGVVGPGSGPDLELRHWTDTGHAVPSRQIVPAMLQWWQGMSATLGAPITAAQAAIGGFQHQYAGWHQAAPWLWWGGASWQPDERFALVVTVAPDVDEQTPSGGAVEVCLPMLDVVEVPVDLEALKVAVDEVVTHVLAFERVLVRCAAGLNRSGLVVGEALAALGMPRDEIVAHLRARRRSLVLSNPRFAEHVRTGRDSWTPDDREARR